MIAAAAAQMPGWKSISVALPAPDAPRVVLTLDSGDGGQPHKRATLTLDRRTGDVCAVGALLESVARAQSAHMAALRAYRRGLWSAGQTVAGLVTAGGAVLVWTGLALALRRFGRWRKRSAEAMPKAA